jgi:hypothetical protein
MSELVRFNDTGSTGIWSNLVLTNRAPVWIGFAKSGILVKASRMGILGKKIYEKPTSESVRTAIGLSKRFEQRLTPDDMRHPLLVEFSNAVLHCDTKDDVKGLLNETYPEPDSDEFVSFMSRAI